MTITQVIVTKPSGFQYAVAVASTEEALAVAEAADKAGDKVGMRFA